MENNIIELIAEIHFCPYCGSPNLVKSKDSDSINCDDCGKDFTVMTHE